MGWLWLLIAGLLEIGWPIGLKMTQNPQQRLTGCFLAAFFMGTSCLFLWLAQRHITMGTSYAVWTGIGAAGTFVVGVIFFGDQTSFYSWLGIILIVGGVALLKLGH